VQDLIKIHGAHLIKIASCCRAHPMFWNVTSAREWDFFAQTVWWLLRVCAP